MQCFDFFWNNFLLHNYESITSCVKYIIQLTFVLQHVLKWWILKSM